MGLLSSPTDSRAPLVLCLSVYLRTEPRSLGPSKHEMNKSCFVAPFIKAKSGTLILLSLHQRVLERSEEENDR